MKKYLLLLASLWAVFLVACSPQSSKPTENAPATSTVAIDGFNYYGDIPTNPERVVSLSAYDTGYLAQLGLNLVGVTPLDKTNEALSSYVADTKEVTSSDLEAIANLEPDVIVVLSTEENIDQLAEIAPVISIDYGVHDYLQLMTDFGQVFNKETESQNWLTAWEEKTAAVGQTIKDAIGSEATFTIVQFFGDALYLRGENSGRGSEIIYQAMGFTAPEKVIDDAFEAGFFALSPEVIGDYAGDYIILSAPNAETGNILEETDVWNNLPAVQNNRVIVVDDNTFAYNDPITLDYTLDVLTELILATTN